MMQYIKNILAGSDSKQKKDASWFVTQASPKEKKKILEKIVDESNKDQRDLVDKYRKTRSKTASTTQN